MLNSLQQDEICCPTSRLMDKTHKVHNPGVNACGSRLGTLVPNGTGSGTSTSTGPPGVNALLEKGNHTYFQLQRNSRENATQP